MSFKKTLVSNSLWSGLGKYSQYLTQILTIGILSRVLTPDDFGVIAIVLSVNGFLVVLAESGFSSTIIQKKELNDYSSIFWFSLFISSFFCILVFLVSDYLGDFFRNDELSRVLEVVSCGLILSGASVVPEGILRKRIAFKSIAIIDLIASVASSLTAIYLAFSCLGYWALVWQILVRFFLRLLLLFFISKWIPSLKFDIKTIRKILNFSSYVLGFNSINYWARNSDNIIIGKVLGGIALGYYSQAYKLMMIPYQGIIGVINPTLHPILSQYQDNINEMRRNYHRVMVFVVNMSVIVAAIMYSWSREIVLVIFGNGWENSISVLSYLGLVSSIQPLTATTGPVLLSNSRSAMYFKLGVFSSLFYVSSFILLVDKGIVALSIGYFCSNVLVSPIVLYFTYVRVLKGRMIDLVQIFGRIIVLFSLYVIASFFLKKVITEEALFLRLIAATIVAVLILIIIYYKQIKIFFGNEK